MRDCEERVEQDLSNTLLVFNNQRVETQQVEEVQEGLQCRQCRYVNCLSGSQ
jgi:hypothetical protein